MHLIKISLVLGICLIFYSYLGYSILIWIWIKIRGLVSFGASKITNEAFQPFVTLIVAAYNEEEFIEQKILNTLSLKYPEDKLQIIFITDGSTDRTSDIIHNSPRIQLLHTTERRGKVAAMHRAMFFVTAPYVIFSDANTLLNEDSITNIVRHYQHPAIGGVAGEKKVIKANHNKGGDGEGIYWKYESILKKLDSQLYTVVGAAGELFSVRKDLYEYPGDNILLDDFVISLKICQKGYRIVYEPAAYAMETPSSSIAEERKRKIRISAGAFQSMYLLSPLLNIFKYGLLSFQYISHRVLRWTLCPLLLPFIFLLNLVIVLSENNLFYNCLLFLQIAFYLAAFAGWFLNKNNIRISVLYVAYYFVFINISLYLGFFRFLKGNQTVLWDKAVREKYIHN